MNSYAYEFIFMNSYVFFIYEFICFMNSLFIYEFGCTKVPDVQRLLYPSGVHCPK